MALEEVNGGHPLIRAPGLVIISETTKAFALLHRFLRSDFQTFPGRGVFATKRIPKDTIVDISPMLIFDEEEVASHTSKTRISQYAYYWPGPSGRSMTQALALGLGSMFNHSTKNQNVRWARNLEHDYLIYTSIRDIEAGEELCISYGSKVLWFDDVEHDPDQLGDLDEIVGAEDVDVGGGTLAELELSGLSGIECIEI